MSSEQPLRGRRIVLTRNKGRNQELAAILARAGAEILELPLIEIHPETHPEHLPEIFSEMGAYEWVIFTSVNGVRYFFGHFFKVFEDIRALGMLRIATVGQATADAVREYHLKVDIVPPQAHAESLYRALAEEQSLDNLRILVVTGNRNNEQLVRHLEDDRAIVDTLAVYHTDFTDLSTDDQALLFREEGADAIVFASASAVQSFVRQAAALQLHPGARHPIACSIGPSTSQAMKKHGIPVITEATEATPQGVLEALLLSLHK